MTRTALTLGLGLVMLLWAGVVCAETIYEIQYTTDPGGDSPLLGQEVTITGLVTAEGYAFGGDYYFVQDDEAPWSGIRVDDVNRAVAEGDEVEITGTVAEVSGMTVINNVTSFDILSSGNLLYDPIAIGTGNLAAEANEGVLMQVETVTVTTPGAGMADFEVDDGTGDCWIGSNAEWYYWPAVNEDFDCIIGVVNYDGGEFKLEPRLTCDIIPPGRTRTIQWVQQVRYSDLMNLNDGSYAAGDTVELTGIVTMPTGLSYAGAGIKFLYEDSHGGPWSGIMSYDSDSTAFPTLFEGDSVRVVGFISEYETSPSSMTEMFITEPIDVLGINLDVPYEPVLPTGDLRWPTEAEQWGTVMVKVQDAVVTNNNLPYAEWWVDDGSGSVTIDDDSDSLSNFIRPPVGTQIAEIRGWVYHHYGYYTDSTTYKIEPLYVEDIVIGSGPPDVLDVIREPAIPMDGDPVSIICEISDNSMVSRATIHYRVNNGALETADMDFSGGFIWEGEIPEASEGDWIDFCITAEDDSGNVGLEPPDTTYTMFCYPVTAGGVLSMAEVQYTPWPSGDSPFDTYEVTVEGVVTGDANMYNIWGAYVLQDADAVWSGMVVSDVDDVLARGDKVQITGIVTEADTNWTYKWGGMTKITECSDVTNTGTGTRTAMEVTTYDLSPDNPDVESYEGLLVTVQDVQVTSLNSYDWSIDDGSGECLIDDDASEMDSIFAMITPGSRFDRITGIFTYSFGTYKIELRDYDDYEGFIGVKDVVIQSPYKFELMPAFPNPFNATTTIHYSLPATVPVRLVVYNTLGQQVRTLIDGLQIAGQHTAHWDGNDAFGRPVASGMYIYRISAGDNIGIHKMVLLK